MQRNIEIVHVPKKIMKSKFDNCGGDQRVCRLERLRDENGKRNKHLTNAFINQAAIIVKAIRSSQKTALCDRKTLQTSPDL